MKNNTVQQIKDKIDLLIQLEIEEALKNKEYEKIKISDLPQIQAYTYLLTLIDKMNLVDIEKQNIVDAWDDMSKVKNGEEYFTNNFKI
jgi:hypothetical protein